MASLFIANCTPQTKEIYYRLDFDIDGKKKDTNRRFEPAKKQTIPPGKQAVIGSTGMHPMQIQDIVDQLARYGLHGVTDLTRRDPLTVVPMVFNVERPVPKQIMERVVEENKLALVNQGKERRRKAAVGANEIVQHTLAAQMAAAGMNAEPTDESQGVEVAFEQLEQSEAGEKRIEEGYRVDAAAAPKNETIVARVKRKYTRRKPLASKTAPQAG
jgi:hypothetical protein